MLQQTLYRPYKSCRLLVDSRLSDHMQEEVACQLLWLSREVHRYVPDFDIGHPSGWQPMASLPPVYRARLLASSISMTAIVHYTFYKGTMHFPCICLGQENELIVGREKQTGHNEDMRGSCMEIEPSPPSNPYGIHL